MPAPKTVGPNANGEITILVPGDARVPKIVSLTSLRGIAALLVAIFHFLPQLEGYFPLSEYTQFLARGYIWVDFFFILSGFIMCYVYGDMFSDSITKADAKRFIILRLVRIYPLHFVILMMFVAAETSQLILSSYIDLSMLTIFSDHTSPFTLLTNVLLLHGLGINETAGWNEPSWSISVEMALYLIFPFLAASPLIRSRTGRIGMAVAALVMLSVIDFKYGGLRATIDYGFFRGLGGFLLGIVVFHSRTMMILARTKYLNAVQAVLVIAVLLLLHFQTRDVLIVPVFVLLIGAVRADGGWLGKALKARPLYVLGVLSYSIYMTHNLVGLAFNKRWVVAFPQLADFSQSPWMVALFFAEIFLVLIVSWFTYRYVERPARYYLRRRLLPA